jgi:nitrate reductase NapAB chaperone NapD
MAATKLSRRERAWLNSHAAAQSMDQSLDPPLDQSSDDVHIVSLLVKVTDQAIEPAKQAAAALPGAQVHNTPVSEKFLVVLESAHERAIADAADILLHISGVQLVSVVAHMVESASDR